MLDRTDVRLLRELVRDPRLQVSQLSTALGMARNTAQARLQRLFRSGILRRGGRELDLAALDYDVVAFVTIEVTHRELDGVISALRTLDQVLEVHEISGRGDLWCRIAARDTHHLQSALRSVLRIKGVIRTETVLALHEHIPYRVEPLLERLIAENASEKATEKYGSGAQSVRK